MKRLGLCILLFSCILNGGCSNNKEENRPEKTVTPTHVVEEHSPVLTPTESAQISEAVTPQLPEITVIPVITPTGAAEATLPVMPTLPPMASPTPTEVAVTESPVKQEEFQPERLGVEPYMDTEGRKVYEAATCFFDENGLCCVGFKAVYDEAADICEIEKRYYLPNEQTYREKETVSGTEALRVFEGKVVNETHTTVAYEPVVYETVSGFVWTAGGTLTDAGGLLGEEYSTKFVCTKKESYIPVKAGESFRLEFYFSWFPEVGGIVFLDKSDRLVTAYSFNSSTRVKDRVITVPEGAEKMHLSLFINQSYRLERQVELVGADLSSLSEEDYVLQSLQTMYAVPKQGTEQYTLDKAYVTFVLDDCRTDMNQIADIFEEYEVPLCIAAIYENLLFGTADGTETRREVCERVVAQGGEILAHDAEVITEESIGDYNKLIEHFYVDRQMLTQMGFEVNGIVLAGGSGQLVGHEVTDIFARAFYRYSDLYGEEKYGEPYYHRRFWLGNCLDTYDEVIANAVEKKEWVVFYLHDLKEVESETLREILRYIKSLPEDAVETVTYKTLYDAVW